MQAHNVRQEPRTEDERRHSKHNDGPGRVGAQSGLGPGPDWGPYGPIWALMGPPGQVLEDSVDYVNFT